MQQKKAISKNVVTLVNDLLSSSIKERATEIFIEPKEDHTSIRFRIKGAVSAPKGTNIFEKKLHHDVVARIKTLTGTMKKEIQNLPQEGKIMLKFKNKEYCFRLITIPTLHGETVSIRNMEWWTKPVEMEKIFMGDKELHAKVKRILERKEGMVLTTGMPGSAKTNIAWAFLNQVSGSGTKAFSIEDVVEILLPSVEQIHVNNKSALCFKTAVDSVIKSDPDVMYVSDIDDSELAKTLLQAAMNWCMVISQLMVPDAVEGLFYFSDMGIREYITGNAVKMVTNTVLEKQLCPHCKQTAKYSQTELKKMGLKEPEIKPGKFYQPKGCQKCENTGYKGRLVILEVLEVNNSVKKAFIGEQTTKNLPLLPQKKEFFILEKKAL